MTTHHTPRHAMPCRVMQKRILKRFKGFFGFYKGRVGDKQNKGLKIEYRLKTQKTYTLEKCRFNQSIHQKKVIKYRQLLQ